MTVIIVTFRQDVPLRCFLVLKVTSDSGEDKSLRVLCKDFKPNGRNPDRFKWLRDLDCNAIGD